MLRKRKHDKLHQLIRGELLHIQILVAQSSLETFDEPVLDWTGKLPSSGFARSSACATFIPVGCYPAAAFRIAMICSSLNRLFRATPPPCPGPS